MCCYTRPILTYGVKRTSGREQRGQGETKKANHDSSARPCCGVFCQAFCCINQNHNLHVFVAGGVESGGFCPRKK